LGPRAGCARSPRAAPARAADRTPTSPSSSAGGRLRPDVLAARRQHLGDAPAFDLADGQVVALDGDLVAGARHPPHLRGHEAAERAHVGGLGELDAEPLGDVVHQREAVEDETLRRLHDARWLAVELVLDLAHDLLDDVLEGDQAGGAPVLVHHDRHVRAALLEVPLQRVERAALGDEEDLALDRRQVLGGAQLVAAVEEVLHVHHADHVVDVGRGERIARGGGQGDDGQVLLQAARERGGAVRRATRSVKRIGKDFGASSPTTMCRNVMVANATAIDVFSITRADSMPSAAKTGARRCAKAGSPIQPRPRLVSVIPSWVAERKTSRRRWSVAARRACQWPSAARASTRVARTRTMANSAATK